MVHSVEIEIGDTPGVEERPFETGPWGDDFSLESFSFRFVLGMMLAGVYIFRGFATVVYAHFLYDVYVMCVWMG